MLSLQFKCSNNLLIFIPKKSWRIDLVRGDLVKGDLVAIDLVRIDLETPSHVIINDCFFSF